MIFAKRPKRTTTLKPLHRRTLLKGAGAAMALPLLEAMLPQGKTAFADTSSNPRFLAYYVPNGMHMDSWRPLGLGTGYTLNRTMAALEPYRDDMLILSNTANHPATPDGNGAHAGGTGAFLTATKVRKTAGANIQNGISIDQYIAQHYKNQTPYSSLELGLDGGGAAGDCDSGFACAYTRNIAWSGPRTPVPKTVDPHLVYARLFKSPYDNLSPEQRQRKVQSNQSVLDLIKSQTQGLQQKLGSNDRAKLDEYFTQVRTLETKLASESEGSCAPASEPALNLDVTQRVDIMADLITVAFQCDLTRVASYMLGNAGSWRSFGFLGVEDAHHQVSHHQGDPSNHAKIEIINQWEIQRLAYLLGQLKNTTDITGNTLLQNTLLFFASEISDGDWHNHNDMPVILAGSMGGKIKTGEHLRFTQERSFGDLFLTIAQNAGLDIETFGNDGTSAIGEILTGS